MIVVSDASPLHYLVLIDQAHLLPALFGRVLATPIVIAELSRPETPVGEIDRAALRIGKYKQNPARHRFRYEEPTNG